MADIIVEHKRKFYFKKNSGDYDVINITFNLSSNHDINKDTLTKMLDDFEKFYIPHYDKIEIVNKKKNINK